MRELHAIGLTTDGRHLLLAATPEAVKASHRVAVDQRFEAVLRGQPIGDPAAGPRLTVKDMQAQLRSGATTAEVAAAAGVPVSRVERFAGPVLAEREAVLGKVFLAHQTSRRGNASTPLGRTVAISLEKVANARLETVEWTAHRRADGIWVASVTMWARGRLRRAQWSYSDADHTVTALDAWANGLGNPDLPARRGTAKPARSATGGRDAPVPQSSPAAGQRPAKTGGATAGPAEAPSGPRRGRVRDGGRRAGPVS